MIPLGVLDHGIVGAVATSVVVVTILLLVERQLLLAHGGERARAIWARQSRAAAVLVAEAVLIIVLRLVELLHL
jgi:hypothetical protein